MKKIMMIAFVVFLLFALNAVSEEEREVFLSEDGVYEYVFLTGDTIQIVDMRGAFLSEVVVPGTIDGYCVVSVGDGAFSSVWSIHEITLPESVVALEGNPFYGLHGLRKINLPPDHPTHAVIDNVLFNKQENSLVCYPSGLSEMYYSVPDGISAIGAGAFYGCGNLMEITLPDSVTKIEEYAFYECEGLTKVILPDKLESIGNQAFSYCENLKEIFIPRSDVFIDGNPIEGCGQLEKLYISPEHPTLSVIDNVLFDKIEKELICRIGSFEREVYAIPDGILSIGDAAFADMENISEIKIPDSVVSIGNEAFANCGIIEIALPEGLESIGDWAFYGCHNITDITIPDSTGHIGEGAFMFLRGLTQITLPQGMEAIGNNMFSDCYSLREIVLPDSVRKIGEYAFGSCISLSKALLPDGLESIGFYAFVNCVNLTELKIPDSVTHIDDTAFEGCGNLTLIAGHDSYAWEFACRSGIPFVFADEDE